MIIPGCGRKQKQDNRQVYHDFIPVLCYHHINPSPSLKENVINTPPADFEEQMKFLHESGYVSVLSGDIAPVLAPAEENILGDGKKPIIITFDDGYRSVYDFAFPVMKKYRFKGVLFVIYEKIAGDKPGMYMNKSQINELIKEGWELGSHSLTHPKLNSVEPGIMLKEIAESRKFFENDFGVKVNSFAYPFGIFNKRVIKLVRENYDYAYTTIKGNNFGFNDLHLVERYLVLKTTEMQNFAMNLTARKLDCAIDTDIQNNVLYVEVTFPREALGRRLQVYLNSRMIRDFTSEQEQVTFAFNSFYEYNNFTIFLQDDAGENYSITKMIHVYRSSDIY